MPETTGLQVAPGFEHPILMSPLHAWALASVGARNAVADVIIASQKRRRWFPKVARFRAFAPANGEQVPHVGPLDRRELSMTILLSIPVLKVPGQGRILSLFMTSSICGGV